MSRVYILAVKIKVKSPRKVKVKIKLVKLAIYFDCPVVIIKLK